jgi:transposase
MGTRVTRAAAHFTVEEVKQRMKLEPRFWVRQRWWIIYNALIAPRKAEEIAKHTGVSIPTVWRVISTYNRLGLAAIETPGTGGRRHEYLTAEQERAFLQPFFARAERGEIATAEQIQQAFEATVKHEVHISTIYRLLDRHGWRKLVPRPRHPKADAQAQAVFKKTSKPRSKQS